MRSVRLRNFFVLPTLVIAQFGLQAQSNDYPEVGKPMPDFTLRNIDGWLKKKATLTDFKGKWLMLDFWNKSCGMCVAAFPHNNVIHKELGDKVQVMQVAIEDAEGQIQPMWGRFKKLEKLEMPSAFDSTLAKRFDIDQCPYIILIDPQGIVRAITVALNKKKLISIMDGGTPALSKAYRTHEDYIEPALLVPYDPKKSFLVGNNGSMDSDFVFRSVLTKWTLDEAHAFKHQPTLKQAAEEGKFEAIGIDLLSLYKTAYTGDLDLGKLYGSFYREPVLEVSDPTVFEAPKLGSNKNWYAYSLIIPKEISSPVKIMQAIQKDLEIYFGYYANVETRKCPYYRFVSTAGAEKKLKTKGGKPGGDSDGASFYHLTNMPLSNLFDFIKGMNSGVYINETGIEMNIDIRLDCLLTGIDDKNSTSLSGLRGALQAYGLDLIKDEKDMQVLVIKNR